MVDVADEGVERADPLAQARRELAPFLGGEDARHDVERNQPLVAVLLAVHGEGDADAVEQAVRLGALLAQGVVGLAGEPVGVDGVLRPDVAVGRVHLVKGRMAAVHRNSFRGTEAKIVPTPRLAETPAFGRLNPVPCTVSGRAVGGPTVRAHEAPGRRGEFPGRTQYRPWVLYR